MLWGSRWIKKANCHLNQNTDNTCNNNDIGLSLSRWFWCAFSADVSSLHNWPAKQTRLGLLASEAAQTLTQILLFGFGQRSEKNRGLIYHFECPSNTIDSFVSRRTHLDCTVQKVGRLCKSLQSSTVGCEHLQ